MDTDGDGIYDQHDNFKCLMAFNKYLTLNKSMIYYINQDECPLTPGLIEFNDFQILIIIIIIN